MEEQVEYVETSEELNELGFGTRLLRFLLRLLIVLIFGAALGMGAYYGIPALYRDFIEPVQSNSERIAALEEAVASVQVDFRVKHSELTLDFAEIEGEVAQQREALSELEASKDGLVFEVEELATTVEDNQKWLSRLEDLAEGHLALETRFSSLEESLDDDDVPYDRLEMQIQLLRVMELVTRARFWMIQGNLGEASDDLTMGKEILENIETEAFDDETLLLIIERLDQILFEISLNPIIAADDLEIVWQLLLLATEP